MVKVFPWAQSPLARLSQKQISKILKIHIFTLKLQTSCWVTSYLFKWHGLHSHYFKVAGLIQSIHLWYIYRKGCANTVLVLVCNVNKVAHITQTHHVTETWHGVFKIYILLLSVPDESAPQYLSGLHGFIPVKQDGNLFFLFSCPAAKLSKWNACFMEMDDVFMKHECLKGVHTVKLITYFLSESNTCYLFPEISVDSLCMRKICVCGQRNKEK